MTNETYFETLAGALNGAQLCARQRDAVLDSAKMLDAIEFLPALYASRPDANPHLSTHAFSVPIVTLKGKPTRKFFHVSIYRMESGRYELTTYLL